MRQGLCTFLATAGLAALTACGGSSPSAPSTPPTPADYAQMSYRSAEIIGGKVIYCGLQRTDAALITHELGHTAGLNHSPERSDVMYRFITGVERFSPAESLSLNMLFERPGGNRFQDNDREVAAAASGTRTVVCF